MPSLHSYRTADSVLNKYLLNKDYDAGRDRGQEEKGMTEDEMAGWHHWLDGREFEWPPGVGDGQGGLACCNSWGRKESDMTVTELNWIEPGTGYRNIQMNKSTQYRKAYIQVYRNHCGDGLFLLKTTVRE